MAISQRALKRFQISNVEATPGTAEAATEILLGEITGFVTDDSVFHNPDQDRASLARNVETPFEVSREVELTMEGAEYDRGAVFQFSNSIRGNVTATQPDMATKPNEWEWVFEPNLTSPNTPDATNGIDTFTLEYEDNIQAYEVEFLFTTTLEITGGPDEEVSFTWTTQGRQITESTITPALVVPPTVGYFAFQDAKFYIDTTYAGIGTTEKAGMLRAFTWTFETQFTARRTASGALFFTGLNEDKKMVNLELTYYRDDTDSEAEKAKRESQAITYLRIELISKTEMDAGQSNPEKIFLDGAFRYSEWGDLDFEDGTGVVTVTAESVEDATAAKMFGATVRTTMSVFA